MKSLLVSLLKPFAVRCYRVVDAVPVTGAFFIFLSLLLVIIIWVWTLRQEGRQRTVTGPFALLTDLRFWATGILLLQMAVYAILR